MKAICTICVLLALCVTEVACKCKPDELEIYSTKSSKFICKKCLLCPPGYGPSHHCGGQYKNGEVMTCKPCIDGKSYSDRHSISSCQPCAQCDGRKTLSRCVVKNNSICSDECKYGYKMDHVVDDCIPDDSIAMTTLQTTQKLTNTLPSSTPKPESKPIHPSTPTQAGITKSKSSATTKPSNDPSNNNMPSNDEDPNHSRDNKIIILTVVGIVVCIVVLYFLWKKKVACFHTRKKEDASKQEEKTALTKQESPITNREVTRGLDYIQPCPSDLKLRDIPSDLKLRDIPLDLNENICNAITAESPSYKSWRGIGEKMGLDKNDLQAIHNEGQKEGTSQGAKLLTKLAALEPNMMLDKFVSLLEQLQRKDVVETIKDFYHK